MIIEDLLTAIAKAKEMTEFRLNVNRNYGVYIHAKEQLENMQDAVAGKISIDGLVIDIGIMAVKELEASDPEYADALSLAAYLFKQWFSRMS
ncbi:immunity protein Tsi6 family protein [Vandammella animalimorsus]|uniref:immunity protein Tsi6 family protein n=1 Tax=Vandammella animalimorsus TaxID=2029117 RepID=UPI0011C38677|nr:immunity protein Tsi6 family protein [Vandammella animalimorsus]